MNIFFNAYLEKNLGDDLFVQVVTNRYPKCRFSVLGDSSYYGIFRENVILTLDSNYYQRIEKDSGILERLWKFRLPTRLFFPAFLRAKYRKIYSLVMESDLNIYVIGSAFMEQDKYRITDYIADYLYYRNKPIVLSCNFGPYNTENYLSKHKKLLAMAKDVCWRDSQSYSLFSEFSNMRREADIILTYNLGEEYFLPKGFGKYAVISVVSPNKKNPNAENVNGYIQFIINIVSSLLESGTKVVLASFCKNEGDEEIIDRIIDSFPNNQNVTSYNYPDINYKQMMGLFKNAERVIATRYHAMIIGLLYQRPTHVIAYSDKTINVLNDIDTSIKWVDTRKLEAVTVENFLSDYSYTISDSKLEEIKASAEKQFQILDEEIKNFRG